MSACKETRRGSPISPDHVSLLLISTVNDIFAPAGSLDVLQLCGVCSSPAGGDKQEVVCAEQQIHHRCPWRAGEAGAAQVCRGCPHISPAVAASLFVLLLLAVTSQLSAASLSPPHLSSTTLTSISVFSCSSSQSRICRDRFIN